MINLKEDIEHIIAKLLEGTINRQEKQLLAKWSNENKTHADYLAKVLNMHHINNPAFNSDEIDVDKAAANLRAKINKPIKLYNLIESWKSVAAILLLPLIVTTLFLTVRVSQKEKMFASTIQEVSTQPGMRTSLTLPDNTEVWLNTGSTLKFPIQFDKKERRVVLNGEAYFKVESDDKHPFIVNVNNMDVIAVGTEFNVESYSEDSISAVTLMDGKVNVSFLSSDEKKLITMKPNQRFVLNSNTFQYDLTETNAFDWQQWKDGVLVFRDESLENVFKRIARSFNTNIIIKDKSISNQSLRATFRNESLDKILQLIEKTSPIKYVRNTNETIISSDKYIFSNDTIEVYKRD